MMLRTYLSVAAICIAGCTSNSTPLPDDTEVASASTSTKVELTDDIQSFGDFSFSIPNGWSVVTPDRDKTRAMLLLDGTNWQNAKAMIKIDVGAPAAPTPRQLADGFANSTGGQVSAEDLDFDGTPGVSASTSSTELTTPRNMIVIYRDGQAYLLMAGATAGVEIGDAVSHIRESWIWIQPNAE